MQRVIQLNLFDHPDSFRLNEDAYLVLRAYLDRAERRLANNPDREEVLRDLDRSIGEKFTHLLRSENRVITRDEVEFVLRRIGDIDTGDPIVDETPPAGRRRLRRIQEGQWLYGVCTGLAAYSGIRLDWVRTIFILLSGVTGGIPVLIYLVLMFALPVVRTHDEYIASRYGQLDAM